MNIFNEVVRVRYQISMEEIKMKKLINILLVLVMSGFVSTSFAASLKWSMPGDSLTLDPHAQNEGPTHMVSRQVYEGLVTPGIDMKYFLNLLNHGMQLVQILGCLTFVKV